MKQKNFPGDPEEPNEVPGADEDHQKSFTLAILWNLGKACEDLTWNHWTSTPHRSETNGIAEGSVRKIKEWTSALLLRSGLDENGGRIPWSVTAICDIFTISF